MRHDFLNHKQRRKVTTARPLRTIRQQRQLAQKASAAVQAEKRRLKETRRLEQVVRDRGVTAAGIRFIATYQPPDVALPPGIKIADVAAYRAQLRLEYEAYQRGYVLAPAPQNQSQRRAQSHAVGDYRRFLATASVEAGGPPAPHALAATTFLNIASLQAVTYFLGGGPLWVRQLPVSYEAIMPSEPWPDDRWSAGFFVLALRISEARYSGRCEEITGRAHACRGEMLYLKPLDLASHRARKPGVDLPASTVPWNRVLSARPLVALTGLPIGINLKRAVRWMVGDWVETDRKYALPWVEPD